MALLKREEWQGFVRDVDWSYSYVDDEAVYPGPDRLDDPAQRAGLAVTAPQRRGASPLRRIRPHDHFSP